MKKKQIAKQYARQSHMPEAAAADQVDRVLSELMKKLRKGKPASLPGLGTFRGGTTIDFPFEGLRSGKKKR